MARADEQEIIELETKFWQSIVDKDTSASVKMLDERSVVTGAQGVMTMTHDDYRRMAEQGSETCDVRSFELEDVQVSFPTDDVAVIAYKVTENMDVEGKPITLEAANATTWVRKDGNWLAALHTESLLGDPFGRDRAKAA
jgi:hypothetical protein